MTTASADVPMKGLIPLLEALAKVRTERPDAHLVVIGRLKDGQRRPGRAGPLRAERRRPLLLRSDRPGHRRALRTRPSSRSCRRCTKASRCRRSRRWPAGSRSSPRPVGRCPRSPGPTASPPCSSPPNDPGALAHGHRSRPSRDSELRRRLGAAGRKRTTERFTWPVTARDTVEQYRELLAGRAGNAADRADRRLRPAGPARRRSRARPRLRRRPARLRMPAPRRSGDRPRRRRRSRSKSVVGLMAAMLEAGEVPEWRSGHAA